MTISELLLSLFALLAAAMLSAASIWAIRPLLLRHALARPNARSSHRVPTPQGAGIAVIAATLRGRRRHRWSGAGAAELNIPLAVFAASLFIAIVGFADDVKSIAVLPRLLLQALAVAAIVFTAPERSADRSGLPALDRARPAAAGGPLVRQPRQLHGRAGLDDGRRGRAGHRRDGDARRARRISCLRDPCCRGAVRRDAGICAVQPPGRQDLSRRRRQPADRPAARLVPAATGLASAIRRRAAAAAVLSAAMPP